MYVRIINKTKMTLDVSVCRNNCYWFRSTVYGPLSRLYATEQITENMKVTCRCSLVKIIHVKLYGLFENFRFFSHFACIKVKRENFTDFFPQKSQVFDYFMSQIWLVNARFAALSLSSPHLLFHMRCQTYTFSSPASDVDFPHPFIIWEY